MRLSKLTFEEYDAALKLFVKGTDSWAWKELYEQEEGEWKREDMLRQVRTDFRNDGYTDGYRLAADVKFRVTELHVGSDLLAPILGTDDWSAIGPYVVAANWRDFDKIVLFEACFSGIKKGDPLVRVAERAERLWEPNGIPFMRCIDHARFNLDDARLMDELEEIISENKEKIEREVIRADYWNYFEDEFDPLPDAEDLSEVANIALIAKEHERAKARERRRDKVFFSNVAYTNPIYRKVNASRKVDIRTGTPVEDHKDLPESRYRPARNRKRQSIQERMRVWVPKERGRAVYYPVGEPVFNDVDIPPRVTKELRNVVRRPQHGELGPWDAATQPFYCLIEPLPKLALGILVEAGVLKLDDKSSSEAVGFSEWADINHGGYYASKYALEFGISVRLREGKSYRIGKDLAEKIYDACLGNSEALERLKHFGFFEIGKELRVESSSLPELVTGLTLDDVSDAVRRFSTQAKYRQEKHATVLRKSDLRPDPEGRRTKKFHDSRQKQERVRHIDPRTALSDGGRKVNLVRTRAGNIPEHIRYITNPSSLYRACAWVYSGKASADFFRTHNPVIERPVEIILRYIQSRGDRLLDVDINEFLSRRNPAIDYRLSKWEKETGRGIISIPHMLGGRFYDIRSRQAQDDGEEMVPVSVGDRVVISAGYKNHPERYVVNQSGLTAAVRRVASGRMNVSDFNILDARSRAILQYVQHLRELTDGDVPYNPEAIASGKAGELKHILRQPDLKSHPYFLAGKDARREFAAKGK